MEEKLSKIKKKNLIQKDHMYKLKPYFQKKYFKTTK
jgi:hypothetical protein